MFCKICGFKNPEGSLYCMKDGVALGDNSVHAIVAKDTVSFCKSCSYKNDSDSNYCMACGISLNKVMERTAATSTNKTFGVETSSPRLAPMSVGLLGKFTGSNFIQAAKYSSLAIVILLISSFFMARFLNSSLIKLFDMDNFLDSDIAASAGLKFISMTDVMMLSHLAGVTYKVSVMGFDAHLITSGWISLFIIPPALILILVGYLVNRGGKERTAIERFYTIVPVALCYALFVAIISTFAGVSVEVEDPTGFLGDIVVSSAYTFSTVFFHALILGVLFMTVGTIIGMGPQLKKLGGNIGFGISIQRALLHTVLGVALCIGLTLLVAGTKEEIKDAKIDADEESYIIDLLLIQTGTYMWNLAHLSSLEFGMTAMYDESFGIEYSLLNGAEVNESSQANEFTEEESEEIAKGVKNLFGSLWYFFFIPVVLHAWAGVLIRKSTAGNLLSALGVYAVTFGIANTAFYELLKLSINSSLDDVFTISFGFSLAATFFYSTLIAFGIAYLAVILLNKKSPLQQEVSSY